MFVSFFGSTINMKYSRYIYAFLCLVGFAIFANMLAWIVTTRLDSEPVVRDTFVSYGQVTMKRSDAESVLAIISAEGFDSAFNHQSTFKDIGDVRFHDLRRAYIAASRELANYLADAAGTRDDIPYYMSFDGN